MAVRRQYAASCGFCFNCGLERPGHRSGSCPDPPACSKCPDGHFSLLHTDLTQDSRRPNPPNNKDSKDKGDKPSTTSYPACHERVNMGQTASADSGKPETTSISSADLSTTETQVLLNVVPVIIIAENGNAVSTYAFLDSGCTDTLVDRSLVDHLDIQGTPVQIGISTITSSDNVVESNRVFFTLSSLESLEKVLRFLKPMFFLTLTSHSEPCQSELMSRITLTYVTLSFQQLTLRESPFLWETTSPTRTYRKKLESRKMRRKDSMVVDTLLVGVLLAAMA